MKEKLQEIENIFSEEIQKVQSLKDVEELKVKYAGKNGFYTELMKMLKNASAEEKPVLGSLINQSKKQVMESIESRISYFQNLEIEKKLESEKIDVTLPSIRKEVGSKHLVTLVTDKIVNIFKKMGFSICFTNEIEESEYNFDKLNIPSDHPARDVQDTFYVDKDFVLRSHTTTYQARVMQKHKPPIKMITFGKVYRGDEPDATHMPIFHQLDVMVVDKKVSMADLKGFLENFAKKIFGKQTNIRMRPSFFPFTEPSVEVDLTCVKCGGKGCPTCKHSGWIEILGGGMINDKVLEASNIDPKEYAGFALGLGIDRIVMLISELPDLRLLYENDVRLLSQYK